MSNNAYIPPSKSVPDVDDLVDYSVWGADVDATIDATSQAPASPFRADSTNVRVTMNVPVPVFPSASLAASVPDGFAPISSGGFSSIEMVEGGSATPPRTETELLVERAAVDGDRSGLAALSARAETPSSGQASAAAPMEVDRRAPPSSNPSSPSQEPQGQASPVDSFVAPSPGLDHEYPAEASEMSADAPAAGTGDGDAARTERVRMGDRWYVPPNTYDQIDVHGQDEHSRHAMSKAPWFERDAITAAREYEDAAPPEKKAATYSFRIWTPGDCCPITFPVPRCARGCGGARFVQVTLTCTRTDRRCTRSARTSFVIVSRACSAS